MSKSASPETMRQMIVERLVGATGDPERVIAAARSCAARALPQMLENLGQELATPVDVTLETVDIVRLADAVSDAAGNDAVLTAASASSPDALTLQIDAAAVSLVLNACFGGDPELAPVPIDRPLTPIELGMAAVVFDTFAKAINGRGQRAFDIRFPLPEPVSGSDAKKKMIVRDGPGVRMVFSISTPVGSGEFRALMPQRFLLENRGDTTADPAAGPVQHATWRARFGGEVMRSRVPLEATVPMGRMTLGELAQLHVGQMIELPASAQKDTRLLSRDRALFVCEFGKLGQNYTVRVRHPFDAGREFIEELIS